ncbi:acyl-homoserine-lactone synthase [Albidovulum sediminicola]|uniref:N-acyl-L-homoserine lactone synthetase n=1 Tax=Albidovulum sediminicola TaxID=2984331 RepID=A0ABT2Z472_9RHOB|nr:acyl-homoserine-lactone synthase [Defluviimonas sp. WL0075]MCV2865948.1 N-acyl-L-homoserine lactone synthetase [Defluviimonas sp. WL0075]
MESTTLSFANLHNHGELFANFMRARRQSFIVHNKWNLPEAMGMEYDQYDTPASRWLVVHDYGEVLGGLRMTPTTARCGVYSYMIRDAQRGLLDAIPSDLLYEEAPVDPQIWEVTRGFVQQSVPAAIRRGVHARMVLEMSRAARELGISQMLALLPTNWSRWAARCGLEMSPAGRVMDIDGVQYQAVSIRFVPHMH